MLINQAYINDHETQNIYIFKYFLYIKKAKRELGTD